MLLEGVEVGGRSLRNRVVLGPYETNLCVRRSIGDRHVDHYARRAQGGVALVVTEIASVHELDWPYERAPLAAACSPGWRLVADAVHAEGALVVAGLGHAGMQGSSAFSQRETWGPSPVPDAITRELPKEMEPADIAAVIEGFRVATASAMAAGMDGVEVNAGQHSLVRQFLSGLTNLRGDDWGPGEDGTGRGRFLQEVLAAVRVAAGDGILGLRLSCDELAPWAGLTPDAAAEIAASVADVVDYLVVVRGSIFSVDATRPDTHEAEGFNLDLVGQIRAAVDGRCPVVAQGSIVDPGQAEWALADGRADLVEMTRAQIADPDLVAKIGGEVDGAVRGCIRCNQRCRVRDNRNPVLTCTVNPSAGHESIDPEAPAHAATGPVVVVGAGPAGLECARVCATAGMDVTIIEREALPGSLVQAWAAAAGREPLAAAVDWLVAECARLGVSIEFDREVAADEVRAWHAEGIPVVLATGSRPRAIDEYQLAADASLLRAEDVLAAIQRGVEPLPDGPVLVWDPVGGPVAISVAETLVARGDGDGPREVHLACPDVTAGTMLSLTGDLASASTRLLQAGVTLHKRSSLRSVDAGSATLVDRFTDQASTISVGSVIDCGHRLPDDQVWHDSDRRATLVGDAVAPRTLFEALLEGRRAALSMCEGRISLRPSVGITP